MKNRIALVLFLCTLPLCAAPWSRTKTDAAELFTAVEEENAKEIKKRLSAYGELPVRENKETLLMAAVKANRDIDVIKEILTIDNNVTKTTDDGVTALMLACQYETHEKVITTIISNSAVLKSGKKKYVLAVDSTGRTAFEYAEKNEAPLAVRKILIKYAEPPVSSEPEKAEEKPAPEAPAPAAASAPAAPAARAVSSAPAATALGESLLMSALKLNSDAARIHEILQAGEEITQKNASGVTPLMYACQYETHDAVITTIIEQLNAATTQSASPILATDRSGKNAFDYALLNENPAHIIGILEQYVENPDPSVYVSTKALEQRAQAKTAPGAAAGSMSPAPLVITAPTPELTVEPYKPTYLFDYAELETEEEITEAEPAPESRFRHTFIPAPDTRDSEGRTLLMKAVRDGNSELIEDLLYSEADIHAEDNDGWTALMFAARFQPNPGIIKRLRALGADVAKTNKYGLSALALAAGLSDNPDIVAALLEGRTAAEKDVRASFIYAVTMEAATDILALFIDKGISVNAPYNTKTPLMYAAENNTSTTTIAWLLKHGAKTTYKTTSGKTAFDFAQANTRLPHNETYWALNDSNGGN